VRQQSTEPTSAGPHDKPRTYKTGRRYACQCDRHGDTVAWEELQR